MHGKEKISIEEAQNEEIKSCNSWTKPVSYTHLDVYKRQYLRISCQALPGYSGSSAV